MTINGKEYPQTSHSISSAEGAEGKVSRIVVHGGKFHADDVFCVAMTLMCYPHAEVFRVINVPEEYMKDEGTIVADIGFGKYDHHQPDAETREDGGKHAACGLLYRDIKSMLFAGNELAAELFERTYIIPVEIADNGGAENPLSCAISAFNPAWDSNERSDAAFAKAVEFVQTIIEREIKQRNAEEKASDMVREALAKSDGKVVEIPSFVPWKNTLIESTAVYVVYPSNRGGNNLQAIPASYNDKRAKKDLPAEWLSDKPEGCTFVHPGLFLACFESMEAALKSAYKVLERS